MYDVMDGGKFAYKITHAGVHPNFIGRDADTQDVIDAIGVRRGGHSLAGGILWRDAIEPLAPIPQVFGHTRHAKVTQYGDSWCVDIGEKDGEALAGIWLPSLEIVEVP